MRSNTFFSLATLAALLFMSSLVVADANATSGGLFTKVSSWTLTATERLNQPNSTFVAVNYTVSGFPTKAKCDAAIVTMNARLYPAGAGGLLKEVDNQVVGECHQVFEIIPVLEVVANPPAPVE